MPTKVQDVNMAHYFRLASVSGSATTRKHARLGVTIAAGTAESFIAGGINLVMTENGVTKRPTRISLQVESATAAGLKVYATYDGRSSPEVSASYGEEVPVAPSKMEIHCNDPLANTRLVAVGGTVYVQCTVDWD